jgi:Calcineurin-like phosphoesterase
MSGASQTPHGRLLCVGDVHGCASELATLLDALRPGADDRLVFLGDYVDRGPASRECLALLRQVRTALPETVFLRGNHEDMFLSYLGLGGENGAAFLANGGAATLKSFGLEVTGRGGPPGGERVLARMSPDEVAFLSEGLVLHHAAAGYTFVHAGVRPGVPIESQTSEDLLWIREAFFRAPDHGLPSTVVFGHTPQREVLFDLPSKIGLDTGCVYGGRLSGLDLTTGVLFQVARGAGAASRRDVRARLG